jgi:hypothetical protein
MGYLSRLNPRSPDGRKHPQDVGYARLRQRPIVDLMIEALWNWLTTWR